MRELLGEALPDWRIAILGTDISTEALATARDALAGLEDPVVVPLYPQYALSTTGSVLDVLPRGVPVVADLASEYDLKGFHAAGADIVIYSAHKFLGGPTAGIVGGKKNLVRSTFLQNFGIGRATWRHAIGSATAIEGGVGHPPFAESRKVAGNLQRLRDFCGRRRGRWRGPTSNASTG